MARVDEMTPAAWHGAYKALASEAIADATGALSWAYESPARILVQRKRNYRDGLIAAACREALT